MPYRRGEGELEWAIFERDYKRIEQAIADGADPNQFDGEDPSGDTPLMYAVRENDLKLSKKLLELGADANLEDEEDGDSALSIALIKGRKKLVTLLTPHTNPRARARAEQALKAHQQHVGQDEFINAVKANNVAKVRKLIKQGVDVNGRGTGTEMTPLFEAAMRGPKFFKMLKLLVEAGADPNGHKHWRPLPWAARDSSAEVIHYLIDHGAEIDVTDLNGWTATVNAAVRGNLETFQALLDRGASITGASGPTILYEIDRDRARPDWPTKRAACEKIYQMVDDALKRNTARGSWLRRK